MGIFFTPGETKKRPGIYQRYENIGTPQLAGATNGVCAIVFGCEWGPVNQVQVLDSPEQAVAIYGKQGNVDVITQLFYGGAKKVIAVRGGGIANCGSAVLADTAKKDVINMLLKYPGKRACQYISADVFG